MYTRPELEALIEAANENIGQLQTQAQNEQRRLRDVFEAARQQFESDIASLNANANSLIGEEKGAVKVYTALLEKLPKEPGEPTPPAEPPAGESLPDAPPDGSGNLIDGKESVNHASPTQ